MEDEQDFGQDLIELKLTPKNKIFYKDDTSFGIFACKTEEKDKIPSHWNFVIKGTMPYLDSGKDYHAKLLAVDDPRYGKQYQVEGIFEDLPTDLDKQKNYLLSVLTEKQVEAIYNTYPDQDIIQLIKDEQFDYSKVYGVGEKIYHQIKEKIIENFEYQEAFDFLYSYGLSNNLIIRLVKHFKSASLLKDKLNQNPYLVTEVEGVGFKKADTIALEMGYDKDGEHRIISAIEHILEQEANNGNVYALESDVVEDVMDLIHVDEQLVYNQLGDTKNYKVVDNKVTLKKYYNTEKKIAKRIVQIQNRDNTLNFDADTFIKEQEDEIGIELTDEQKSLFYNIQKSNVTVLSGYAGAGKTSTQQLVIRLLDQLGITYTLLSPTGRASKVLSNHTGRDASTVHRAIGMGRLPEEQIRTLIESKFVIVDEFSMADVMLTAKLLDKCAHPNVKLLFVGDSAQLPAVGVGNILHNLIESDVVPSTTLTQVFRQDEGGILDVATKTRQGNNFLHGKDYSIEEHGDNCKVALAPKEKVQSGYQYFFREMLKHYKPHDITVLTPTKKGDLGTVEINKYIQGVVNPYDKSKQEYTYGQQEITFREGDYIMNTENTYKVETIDEGETNIYNGDTGVIDTIDHSNKIVTLSFDDATVEYRFEDFSKLMHAWCLTMHKSQGSAMKVVIMIINKSDKFILNRNLVYTGETRTTDHLFMLTQPDTLKYALKRSANIERNTFLPEFLEMYNKTKGLEGYDAYKAMHEKINKFRNGEAVET